MNATMKWSVDPLQFIKTVNQSVDKKTEELAEEIFDGVVARSPVDTGSFRQAWTATVGFPTFQFTRAGSSNSPLPAPTWPRLKVRGQPIYICNGSPYGGSLENGHSNQAPLGIVSVTLAGL